MLWSGFHSVIVENQAEVRLVKSDHMQAVPTGATPLKFRNTTPKFAAQT